MKIIPEKVKAPEAPYGGMIVHKVPLPDPSKLSPKELKKFQKQLSAILDYAEMLQQVDTTGVPPTASAIPRSAIRSM